MKVLRAHILLRLRQLVREPGYVASTMVFPALFFLLFALPNADTPDKAKFLMASFTAFAVIGVCLFQFGVHQAQELKSGWYSMMRTLPVRAPLLFFSSAFNTLVCGIAAAAVVYLTVEYSAQAGMDFKRWSVMTLAALVGAIPFALIAAAIANWVSAWAALPVFNLIYILSSFAGGLWMPPAALPAKVASVSEYLPTRHYGEILWKLALGQEVEMKFVGLLALFGLFGLVAVLVSRRLHRELQKI